MKRIIGLATLLGVMALSSGASANVSKADLFVGRMTTPQACFVMVTLAMVEQNMFNGQEMLKVGDTELGSFAALQSAGVTSLKPSDSVFYGSAAFESEVGFKPDITIPDAACEQITSDAEVSLRGSFGDLAALLGIPPAFSELDVVGQALVIHLETEKFKLRSLTGEKEIGGTGGGSTSGGTSSGDTTSGGTTSGGTTSGGTTSGDTATPGTSGAPAAGSGDDGGCAVTGAGAGGSTGVGLFALGLVGIVAGLVRGRGRGRR